MSRPTVAYIHLGALCQNYLFLQKKAYPATVIAVVKADAYGHSLLLISRSLYQLGCRDFAVSDVSEAISLRHMLGNEACIVVLSGLFDSQEAAMCVQYQLTPFVSDACQLVWLAERGFKSGLWLKVNSGMNRLGCQDVMSLIRICEAKKLPLCGLCSHLACADTPEHPLNYRQIEYMQQLQQLTQLPVSLLNSAGLLSMPACSFDAVRPGIALYGANPLHDAVFPLQPVMRLCARVMQVRDVAKGAYLSYGGTYQAKKNMKVALVPLGYADGLPRALSNIGYAMFATKRLAIVGRVCMDYCLLDVSDADIDVGDECCFWGESPTANTVADAAGTISYTLFTGVGARVKREVMGDN